MDTSIYLAKLIGIYLMVTGLAWFIRRDAMRALAEDYVRHPFAIGFSGVVALALGLAIVIGHNVWTGWPIIITLLGYVMLAKGILRLYAPDQDRSVLGLVEGNGAYVLGGVALALGIVLTVLGFVG
jgi:uncharacterized membrane protein